MIFLFYGPNTYASRRKLQQMVETYQKKTGSAFSLERIDGTTTDLKQITGALLAVPFLASSRLVIIERLSANKAVADKLTRLLDQIPVSTVAVFYETEIDQRALLFKSLVSNAKAVKFDKLNSVQLSAWVKREVARHGGSIDRSALAQLLEICGDDQWRLEQEIIKLVSFRPEIKEDTVKELVVASHQQTIFDLVDAIAAGRSPRALRIFHNLREDNTSEAYILSMIAWQLRNLLLAKTAGAITPPELARKAGMSPFVAGKALARQHEFDLDTLRRAYLAVIETDYAIKNGEGKAETLVESLIYRLSTQTRQT